MASMIVIERTCEKCGGTYRSDEVHQCTKTKQTTKPTTKPVTPTETRSIASEPGERMTPLPVKPLLRVRSSSLPVNCPHCGRPMLKTDDKATYQRNYMRRRRAKQEKP